MRQKTCKHCKEKYAAEASHEPFRRWCSTNCAISLARAAQDKARAKQLAKSKADHKKKAKAERKELRARKEALKSKSDWLKEAQAAVNAYIRARDRGKPCISCGKPDVGVRNASHYRSAGACSALRFNTFNIHASCYSCNCELSGNLLEYRIRLITLLGAERVEWLEAQNGITRYDIDYLKRVKRIFNRRAKLKVKKSPNSRNY